jgi:hypothetical protein
LTFLTGSGEDNDPYDAIVVSAIIVAIGGGYLLWRRNAQRPTGRHRRTGASDRLRLSGVRD